MTGAAVAVALGTGGFGGGAAAVGWEGAVAAISSGSVATWSGGAAAAAGFGATAAQGLSQFAASSRSAGSSSSGNPVGTGGTRTTSTSIGSARPNSPYYRIDVENPNPGVRPGNLHIQDGMGGKYYYDFDTDTFTGAPKKWLSECESDPKFSTYITRGKQYLNIN